MPPLWLDRLNISRWYIILLMESNEATGEYNLHCHQNVGIIRIMDSLS